MIASIWMLLSCMKPVPLAAEPPTAMALPALRGPLAPMPAANAVLTRISFGSCASQNRPMPIMQSIIATSPDLFVMLGDNVYGDADSGDSSMPELREAYARLAQHPDFRPFSQQVPVLPIWDDHDYGQNDGGGDFAFRAEAERIFESFWRIEVPDERAKRDGVYGAWVFGPMGQRVQLVLLDTRFFRSPLTRVPKAQRATEGRYRPSADDGQDMLGAAQWEWLEQQLAEPAELRVIVSSIQVLADNHGWERWGQLPAERSRLLALLHQTPHTLIVSGDRHWSSMYRDETGLTEMTTSSINRPIRRRVIEMGSHQFTTPFEPANFGELYIDWPQRTATLTTYDATGISVASVQVDVGEALTPEG